MGLRLFFLPNFPGTMFIQGATFIPDSRVTHNMTTDCSLNYKFNTSKFFLTFRTIFVHNMFSSCFAKRRASDKDLPVKKKCLSSTNQQSSQAPAWTNARKLNSPTQTAYSITLLPLFSINDLFLPPPSIKCLNSWRLKISNDIILFEFNW